MLDARRERVPQRPQVRGKFIFSGEDKIPIRGVTYGAFKPDEDGREYQDLERVDRDFALMANNGITAVRIPHTTPPRALLDVAQRHGLWVMVGLSIEQEIGYFIDSKVDEIRRIEKTLSEKVRSCSGHPQLLCYALGNEIPASVARWLGRRRVERILRRMYEIARKEDPEGIFTYVNYPTTEYLQLPFLDMLCFNVYLESQDRLRAYLARLQNIAGDRPLLMSELGLDAMRNGEETQARTLEWQIATSYESGCAGVFVFSWTDEWHRAGAQVDDWAFGITDIDRNPKPALAAVREAFDAGPWARLGDMPQISVVVCTFNGSKTIRQCCESLSRLDYPKFEVIVVDDGSSDGSGRIVEEFGFKLIRHDTNRGLSAARNSGLEAATGDIVAYIDDDAFADIDWLRYIALTFETMDCVAVGGPNVSPNDDPEFARRVAEAPGNPAHVLLTDTQAEQLPGCNIAIRRSALEAIDGFDPRFVTAGDDVDVCLRLRERGWTLAYCAAAMVWHRRRASLAAYLKQQSDYGVAENLLDRKWNLVRDSGWRPRIGRVYGSDTSPGLGFSRLRIYHGVWGNAPFQSVYAHPEAAGLALHHWPVFYLTLALLIGLSVLSPLWPALWVAFPVFCIGFSLVVIEALIGALASTGSGKMLPGPRKWKAVATTTLLYLLQPIVRHWGRFVGLRQSVQARLKRDGGRLPKPLTGWRWSETWIAPETRIAAIESELRVHGIPLTRGGDYDPWDFELHAGVMGGARMSLAIEDHSGAAQMIRYRIVPHVRLVFVAAVLVSLLLAILAAADSAWAAALVLAIVAGGLTFAVLRACSRALGWGLRALDSADQ